MEQCVFWMGGDVVTQVSLRSQEVWSNLEVSLKIYQSMQGHPLGTDSVISQ